MDSSPDGWIGSVQVLISYKIKDVFICSELELEGSVEKMEELPASMCVLGTAGDCFLTSEPTEVETGT